MALKPPDFEWSGYTPAQLRLLNVLDVLGANDWACDTYMAKAMPSLIGDLGTARLPLNRVGRAMTMIGYSREAVTQLEWWSQRTRIGT